MADTLCMRIVVGAAFFAVCATSAGQEGPGPGGDEEVRIKILRMVGTEMVAHLVVSDRLVQHIEVGPHSILRMETRSQESIQTLNHTRTVVLVKVKKKGSAKGDPSEREELPELKIKDSFSASPTSD